MLLSLSWKSQNSAFKHVLSVVFFVKKSIWIWRLLGYLHHSVQCKPIKNSLMLIIFFSASCCQAGSSLVDVRKCGCPYEDSYVHRGGDTDDDGNIEGTGGGDGDGDGDGKDDDVHDRRKTQHILHIRTHCQNYPCLNGIIPANMSSDIELMLF